jgi:endonuclease-3
MNTTDKERDRKERDWDLIFTLLRENLQGAPLPSVTLVAELHPRDPFRVLIGTMISLRTKDKVTFEATERLFSRASRPGAVLRLSEEEIADLIFPAGFFRVKAKSIKETCHILESRYGGQVPSNREELLGLPGVGRKTANLVLNLGFRIEAICVDTHVHRIANRIGWVRTRTPDETEMKLMEILPRRYWIPVNELLVGFGQKICTPASPRCSVCLLYDLCERRGVDRRR